MPTQAHRKVHNLLENSCPGLEAIHEKGKTARCPWRYQTAWLRGKLLKNSEAIPDDTQELLKAAAALWKLPPSVRSLRLSDTRAVRLVTCRTI